MACQRDNYLILWYFFKHFVESASSSYNQSNVFFFLLYDFLKCIATEFKSTTISLDMSLQGPTFVTSIATKFVLCITL